MSHEFYQIMVGAPSMSLYSWKQLALWSIEYSCLNDPDKIKGRDILLQTWAVFCAEIVEEYGELLNGEDLDVTKAEKAYLKLKESP
jgi:adenosine deaminase CECR1